MKSSMQSSLSVVIPSTGSDLVALQRLLSSLQMQSLNIHKQISDVIVVFNGIREENHQEEWRQTLTAVTYTFNLELIFLSKKGANLARNEGIRKAASDVVVFFDDDCEVDTPLFLETHLKQHELHPDVFAFGGGYQLPSGAGIFDEVYNEMQQKWLQWGRKTPSEDSVQFLLGGNCSIKKSMARKHQLLFDENLVYGGTEMDFFRSSELAGLTKVLLPIDVIHHTHENFTSLTKKIWKQGRGGAYSDQKFQETFRPANFRAYPEHRPFIYSVLFWYLNYVFWTGYYFQMGAIWKIVPHFFKEYWGRFQKARYQWVEKIKDKISEKQDQGGRF